MCKVNSEFMFIMKLYNIKQKMKKKNYYYYYYYYYYFSTLIIQSLKKYEEIFEKEQDIHR